MLFKINSTPLKFCMCECEEKSEVKRLVNENGGLFLKCWEKGAVMIVPYDVNFRVKENSEYDQVSYKFVYDSVALQSLQPINEYLLEVIKPCKKQNSVKIAYTDDEDRAMREYVSLQNGNPRNLSYWKTFRIETGLSRTADSLRAHWKILAKNHANEFKVQKIVDPNQSIIVKKPGKPLSIVFEHKKALSKNGQKIIDIPDENTEALKNEKRFMQETIPKNFNTKTTNKLSVIKIDKYTIPSNDANSEEKNEEIEILEPKHSEKDHVSENLIEKIPNNEVQIKDIVMKECELIDETIKCMEFINIEIKAKPGKELNETRIEELFDNLVDLCRLKNKNILSPEEIVKALIYFDGNVQDTVNFFALNNNIKSY